MARAWVEAAVVAANSGTRERQQHGSALLITGEVKWTTSPFGACDESLYTRTSPWKLSPDLLGRHPNARGSAFERHGLRVLKGWGRINDGFGL